MVVSDPALLLRQGLARHQAGDIAGAEHIYRQVLVLRPGDANALNLLGQIARAKGELRQAVDLTAQALAARPGAPVFLAAHGAVLAEAGQLDRAVSILRAAVAARPEDAVSLRNLGQALVALGRVSEALVPLRRAVALQPASAEAHLALAHACREAGDRENAITHARRAASEARLAGQARFLLAALGAEAAPDRAPAAYVKELFDQYATRFDEDLTARLGYRTPEALSALLTEAGLVADGSRRVLDLGCGTGLSGLALAPFAARLEGLDLSPRMLAEARARGIYDALHEADLMAFLPRQKAVWELIAAADVLNYLGDLEPVLPAMASAMTPGGLAAFSVEVGAEAPFALGPGLRYRHQPDHLRGLFSRLGFGILAERESVLRQEKGEPVHGMLWVLRRSA